MPHPYFIGRNGHRYYYKDMKLVIRLILLFAVIGLVTILVVCIVGLVTLLT